MAITSHELALALSSQQQGDHSQAESICRQILQADPHNTEALQLLGIVCHQTGRPQEAIDALRRCLETRPTFADAHYNLARILREQGHVEQAADYFQEAVRLKPDFVEAHFNLANAYRDLGRMPEAIQAFEESIRHKPGYAKAHNNLGNLHLRMGSHEDALVHLRQAVALAPQSAKFRSNLEVAFRACGQSAQHTVLVARPKVNREQARLAIATAQQADSADKRGEGQLAQSLYERALKVNPAFPEALLNFGAFLGRQGKHEDAVERYREAIRHLPDFAEAYVNLGSSLTQLEKWDDALASLGMARKLKPNLPELYNNLANVFSAQHKYPEAEGYYRHALQLRPDDVEVQCNLAVLLYFEGKHDQALDILEQVLHEHPQNADAHYKRALVWLSQGNFASGFAAYEWRWQCKEFAVRSLARPLWDGSSLKGKSILLHCEQGFGDIIQFIRYASLVKDQGSTVFLEGPAALLPLLRSCSGIDQLIARNTSLPRFDVHAPLMSLPHIFRTSLETIPAKVPYLSPEPARVEYWRDRVPVGYKVGLCWQGNTQNKADKHRSTPLREFAPLARVPGVKLISLQKGLGDEQLQEAGKELGVLGIEPPWDEDGAFLDSAAIMKHLDLVVTCDSAVAHLAGALGVPVWVAIPFVNDWRWMIDREDSPWYPSMRLFRQRTLRCWSDVFECMANELTQRTRH